MVSSEKQDKEILLTFVGIKETVHDKRQQNLGLQPIKPVRWAVSTLLALQFQL